ncbi:MAG TPA: hypothetical protein PKZ08_14040, partial [Vicinamibacterales bacterium]|nr:hypothetical protein [Vicinamibacterales bacterium]
TWSSILNQPTGEFYMVSVDEQFPYRLYGPQQDNTTVVVPSLPPVAWGLDSPVQAWGQVAGCETGQVWPRPDGSVVWGACKGQVGRYVTATGQEQQYWVYPQNRYGHNPKDIKYRFPRQTVVYLSPHDPKTIYQASHVVHRSVDEGVTWETISHDLTAYEPDKQITPGTPITRDITGEEVYSSLYAFVESRLEPGVLWAGSNDGPVHVSRDAGKSWRRVTPPDLPPGGRVQTIEDSPHRKGSAYIAVYRYLREHDLEPYIYATADYGATWTRLTDGRNGIPGDHPTRVVREDPSREGLLYAGTEFGLFVSFDNGRHWQPLQQNLPHTPVTDIRVHRQDLVLSTMGRGFWILDDVTLLQQLAARHELVMHSEGYLFQPRDAWRMRYRPTGGSAGQPEYPPPGAIIDYYLAGEPAGEVKLEIMDGKRGVIRTLSVGGGAGGAAGAPGQAAGQQTGPAAPPRRGRAGAALPRRAWHNRFVWDLRLEGSGGSPGPLAVPGSYLLRLSVGEWSQTRTIEVRIDPRVAAAGVTQADLQEQLDLALAIRDAMSGASALASKIAAAGQAATANAASARALQSLHGRLVTAGGAYPQPMLIDQLANVALMISQADQKVGRDAFARFEDLSKELAAVEAEAARLGIR